MRRVVFGVPPRASVAEADAFALSLRLRAISLAPAFEIFTLTALVTPAEIVKLALPSLSVFLFPCFLTFAVTVSYPLQGVTASVAGQAILIRTRRFLFSLAFRVRIFTPGNGPVAAAVVNVRSAPIAVPSPFVATSR